MLFGAFRPQTTRETKKSQPPSEAEGSAVPCSSHRMPHGSDTLPFVIPSEAEGSAVLQARPGNVFRQSTDAVEVKGCRAYGARTMLGNLCLSPAGLGCVWRSALRASMPRPLPRKTFPGRACRPADPSASLGMTKGRVSLPCASGGWLREQQIPIRLRSKRALHFNALRSG